MSARRIDKENKKRDIAFAAMSVFTDHGFESASMSQVAREAGVGKGTIYEYFSSKDDLIAMSIRLWMDSMIEETERALEKIPDPESRLKAYVQSWVDMFLHDEKMPRLIVSIFQLFMTKLNDTTYGDTLRVMFRAGVSSVEKILLEGMESGVFKFDSYLEAEKVAVNLVAFLDGICLDYLATAGAFDLRDQVDHYMKYLLEADIK
jgi:TetR/AcrR family fatty acid metabolism transcriptional regulator